MKSQVEKHNIIDRLENNFLDYAVRQNQNNLDKEQDCIKIIADVARGTRDYPPNLNTIISINNFYTARDFLLNITSRSQSYFNWTEKDPIIQGYITKESLSQQNSYGEWNFIRNQLSMPFDTPGLDNFIKFLHNLGITDEEITKKVGVNFHSAFITWDKDKQLVETYFAKYIKPNLKSKSSFLGFKNSQGLGTILDELVNDNNNRNNSHIILRYLMDNCPDCITDFTKYVTNSNYHGNTLNTSGVKELLEIDPERFEKFVIELTTTFSNSKDQFSIYLLLAEAFPGKYHDKIIEFGERTLNKFCGAELDKKAYHSYEYVHGGSAEIVYAKYLLQHDKQSAILRLLEYTNDSQYINAHFLQEVEKLIPTEMLPLLLNSLNKEYTIVDNRWQSYFWIIFDLLKKYDLKEHTEQIIKFGIDKTPKKYRVMASEALKNYIDLVTPRALQLLDGKVNDRILGAMILQNSEDPEIKQQLLTLIDTERSDDTRDIMLDALRDMIFKKPMSRSEVSNMIEKANARRKLNKWSEKWLEEESLPRLHWQDGKALSEIEVRFLFYRSKRAKGMSSEIEAKQAIELLGEKNNEKFALSLIQAYQESNADSKLKYYLVMSGLIGKDKVLNRLYTVFKSTVSNKRYRMAAMIVSAIAMVGTDKALRIVDMISRKFANKRPQIGRGAKEALDAAANELGITKEQLADRIIPDLGFENHYFHFNSGEDKYRAFINKEFKLNYFNEDNKLRKSIPKDVSRETKAELKNIEKEIREVVKNQKGRLENYLITERFWEVEEWMQYYLSNPVMLIYVQRLLWGVYDDNHQLVTTFYCDDDLELYDVEDEEVDIKEGTYIKILHPLHMKTGLLNKWKEKVYNMEKEFEFEIINRTISTVPPEEAERNVTKILFGEEIPKGADYVAGFLEKKGWVKSTGDGGCLLFNKINEKNGTNAFANIEGPAAYYQGGTAQAKIFELSFTNANNRERVALKQLSEVFFSEVVGDLKALINA